MTSTTRDAAELSSDSMDHAHTTANQPDDVIQCLLRENDALREAHRILAQRRNILYKAVRETLRANGDTERAFQELALMQTKFDEYRVANARLDQENQLIAMENDRWRTHVETLQKELATASRRNADMKAKLANSKRDSVEDANKRRIAELTAENEIQRKQLQTLQQADQEKEAKLKEIEQERAAISNWAMVFQPPTQLDYPFGQNSGLTEPV